MSLYLTKLSMLTIYFSISYYFLNDLRKKLMESRFLLGNALPINNHNRYHHQLLPMVVAITSYLPLPLRIFDASKCYIISFWIVSKRGKTNHFLLNIFHKRHLTNGKKPVTIIVNSKYYWRLLCCELNGTKCHASKVTTSSKAVHP